MGAEFTFGVRFRSHLLCNFGTGFRGVGVGTIIGDRQGQPVDHARHHGRVTIGDVVRVTGASRNTLKEHFRRLATLGHLKQHRARKGTWYGLP